MSKRARNTMHGSAMPPEGTAVHSRHELFYTVGGERTTEIFEWVGTGWSTPGTQYHTSPSAMSTAGWKYGGPAIEAALGGG